MHNSTFAIAGCLWLMNVQFSASSFVVKSHAIANRKTDYRFQLKRRLQ